MIYKMCFCRHIARGTNIKRSNEKKTHQLFQNMRIKLYIDEAIIESIMKSQDNIGRKYDSFAFFWQT